MDHKQGLQSREVTRQIPEGCYLAPLEFHGVSTPIGLSVLVREEPRPDGALFFQIRETGDVRVYLGAVTAQQQQVLQWVEIWVQDTGQLEDYDSPSTSMFGNAFLDWLWAQRWKHWLGERPDEVIQTGWETQHPSPSFLRLSSRSIVALQDDRSGDQWKLCVHEQRLMTLGLPSYTSSRFRYLITNEDVPERTQVVGLHPEAPACKFSRPASELWGTEQGLIPFNPQGGHMMVVKHHPVNLDRFLNWIHGVDAAGKNAEAPLSPVEHLALDWKTTRASQAALFLGEKGRWSRHLEMFHIKLMLIRGMFQEVKSLTAAHQMPLFNLSPSQFALELPSNLTGSPWLWGARVRLMVPGESMPVALPESQSMIFRKEGPSRSHAYLPEGLGLFSAGTGEVTLSKIMTNKERMFVIDFWLQVDDTLQLTEKDLVRVRIPLAEERVNLAGFMSERDRATHRIRIQTIPMNFPEEKLLKLEAVGVFRGCPFEVLPLWSSPCDLFSLAVLAAKILLSGPGNPVSAVREKLRMIAAGLPPQASHDECSTWLERQLSSNTELQECLGPKHAGAGELEGDEAAELIPSELWRDVLIWLARLFPGWGAHSYCHGLENDGEALDVVFDAPLRDLDRLIETSRLALFSDYRMSDDMESLLPMFDEKYL